MEHASCYVACAWGDNHRAIHADGQFRLGGHAAFLEWARDNRTEYYRIASRLSPGEMQEDNGAALSRSFSIQNPMRRRSPLLWINPEGMREIESS